MIHFLLIRIGARKLSQGYGRDDRNRFPKVEGTQRDYFLLPQLIQRPGLCHSRQTERTEEGTMALWRKHALFKDPHQPGTPARWRLHNCHLLSWLHCLATGCLGLFSALEEEAAFLHGPSGSSGLARAWPHDGFTDYNFLMWGLLSHVADPIPSGVCSWKELREGQTPRAGCSHWEKCIFVQAGVGACDKQV